MDSHNESVEDPLADQDSIINKEKLKEELEKDSWLVYVLMFSLFYGFFLIPLVPFLLHHPWIYSCLGSGISPMVTSGAHYSIDHHGILIPIIFCTISSIKFIPFYWLMGKKWGDDFISVFIGNNSKIIKKLRSFEHHLESHSFIFMFILKFSFIPLDLTHLSIFLGNMKVSLRKVLINASIVMFLYNSLFYYLGYKFGHHIITIINMLGHWMFFITIGIFIFIMRKPLLMRMKKR